MNRLNKEFVKKTARELLKTLALKQEILILCGCNHCGRRLVEDNHIIEGARVLYLNEGNQLGVPLCEDCFAELVS